MSDPLLHDPPRLLDDPTLGAALRSDLELVEAAGPQAYDASAGLARFEAALASGGPAALAGGSSASGPGALRMLGWLVGAAVLVGGAVGAGVVLDHADAPQLAGVTVTPSPAQIRDGDDPVAGAQSPSASARAQGPRVSTSVAEAQMHERGEAEAGQDLVSDTHSGEPPRPASKPASGPADSPAASSADASSDAGTSLADEARLIAGARKALARDPAKALALVDEAQARFPKGAMIQERRGYRILALVGLDRVAEAKTEAGPYLERWPNGTLSNRVRGALP